MADFENLYDHEWCADRILQEIEKVQTELNAIKDLAVRRKSGNALDLMHLAGLTMEVRTRLDIAFVYAAKSQMGPMPMYPGNFDLNVNKEISMNNEVWRKGAGRKWGVWNSVRKQFQFGIKEDSPCQAHRKLFKRIGYDSLKYRFVYLPYPTELEKHYGFEHGQCRCNGQPLTDEEIKERLKKLLDGWPEELKQRLKEEENK